MKIGSFIRKFWIFLKQQVIQGSIAKHVEACLNNWELKRVLSVTMDNASTNDVEV